MCLHPQPVDSIPEETARVASAAFRKPTTAMTMRDELGAIFSDEQFASLFPARGKPAFSPWRLALVTVLQFAENLSDRQAADAVRGRLDWKYCLSLELTDPGFDASILCEFRSRLEQRGKEMTLLETLLEHFRELGLLKARGRQRTDSTHVLANVRKLNRLELAGETMRLALNALAEAAPEWLRERTRPEWIELYALPFSELRLPEGREKRTEQAEKIGRDGFLLLECVFSKETPYWIGCLPEVQTLRKVWLQNYLVSAEGGLRWRKEDEGLPPAGVRIDSPTDPDCRYRKEGSTMWLGYKVHVTETCESGSPRLITDVQTVPASLQDTEALIPLHEALSSRDLLPSTNVVDMGYADSTLVLEVRKRYGVDVLGPMRGDNGRHAKEQTRFATSNFHIDWENQEATCPEGKKSSGWSHRLRHGKPAITVSFSPTECGACPSMELCTGSTKGKDKRGKMQTPRRVLTVVSKEQHEALRIARERESTRAFTEEYAWRGGIEGTVSRAVSSHGLRRTRYRGLQRVHLGHALTATAVNFARAREWIGGKTSARSPSPPLVRLMTESSAI